MAKRKRLGPAQFLDSGPESVSAVPIAQVAGQASEAAALAEVSAALTSAREEGRLVERLALGEIDAGHLVRDRLAADDAELEALATSLRARGQQVPVEVVDRGDGASPRYGLISGWRRVHALGQIGAETVLAFVRAPGGASEAYVAMVEENEIRVGLSFFERARIVLRAVEAGVFADDRIALRTLFASASRAKRSKVKSFMRVVAALEGALRFPGAIGERLGLQLAQGLEADAGLAGRLRDALAEASPADAEAEAVVLRAALKPAKPRAVKAPVKAPVAAPFPEGITVTEDAKGRLILEGTGVTPTFRRYLEKWLQRMARLSSEE